MISKDKCTNLVSSWAKTTTAGSCLRSVQKNPEYKQFEAAGQYPQAYALLLSRLRSLAIPPKVRRRQLEEAWLELQAKEAALEGGAAGVRAA